MGLFDNLTPAQQAIFDKIQSGDYSYTFGPGSPNATWEDRNTFMGGKFSPAGGFAVHGGWALAPQDYYLFTPEQRRALGIMDIAPRNQQGLLEKYFAAGGRGLRKLYSGGMNSARNLFGGRPSGPWSGWNRQDIETWRNSPGYEQVNDPSTGNPYFGTNPPGQEQGGPTMLNTNWVSTPWGNVPMALLNNPQASLFPPIAPGLQGYIPTAARSQNIPGTGGPTQNAIGALGALGGNILFPGLGFITGALAKTLTRWIQNGMSPQAAIAKAQAMKAAPPATSAPMTGNDWFSSTLGNYPKGYLAQWYGKGQGGEFGRPGDASTPSEFGNNASSWGSNTTSFVGGGGNPNLPTGGSYFGGPGQLVIPGGAPVGNLGGSGGRLSDSWSNAIGQQIMNHALKFGTPHSGIGYPAPALTNAFMTMPGAVRGGWTPQAIEYWRNRPLNTGAGGGEFSGAGRTTKSR